MQEQEQADEEEALEGERLAPHLVGALRRVAMAAVMVRPGSSGLVAKALVARCRRRR